ncbi:MAG TPA: ABC transporter ATP-binding protein, partial [Candidatus Latescibacteria bacterium]|nr:ABC transporter ATP-binding protein [Candidatus Latescibacterota bacterium]
SVYRGDVFGLLGPNGAGKTTTLRLLLGLISPTSGTARVLGHDVGDGLVRERVGALLEEDGLYERLTAWENLEYYARIYRMGRERKDGIREVLGGAGLLERAHEPLSRWSKGMRRTLALLRAFLHDPDVAFLDEPTIGLDPIGARKVREALGRAAGEGRTIFLTTHNLKEAEELCSRIGVLHRGRLLAVGTPHEVSKKEGGHTVAVSCEGLDGEMEDLLAGLPFVAGVEGKGGEVRVLLKDRSRTPDLVRFLIEQGVRVYAVRPEGESLEEAFVALVGAAEEGL